MKLDEPAFYWEDSHLADLLRDAEKARPWWMRINWRALLGAAICVASFAATTTFFVYAYIWSSRWYR